MAEFEWTDELSVGFDEIDDDHRQLLDILNEFQKKIDAGSDSAEIQATFTRLVEYAVWHFAHEETIMRDSGYPGTEKHCLQHRELTDNANDLYASHMKGDESILEIVIPFVRNWLTNHIMLEDKQLGRYLAETSPQISKK